LVVVVAVLSAREGLTEEEGEEGPLSLVGECCLIGVRLWWSRRRRRRRGKEGKEERS